jgi:hypothetical protein
MDGDLIASSYQVHLGEDRTAKKLVGVVMYMAVGVAVGNGSGFECPVIAAGAPTIVLFGHDV